MVGVQAQQRQVRIGLAAFVPRSDIWIPQPVDHGRVGVFAQRAADAGEQIVALAAEGADDAAALPQHGDQRVVLGCKEPDRSTAIAFDLCGHRTRMTVFDTIQAQHHGAI